VSDMHINDGDERLWHDFCGWVVRRRVALASRPVPVMGCY